MLTALSIRDLVLIDSLDQGFENGLCVLTGETGAGKSILLDALGLALGGRGDAALVRMGADKAVVTAAFSLPDGHHAERLLDEHGLESGDDLVVRRIQSADGKSRVLINDQPASVGLLRQIGAHLAEIHGQHDVRALMDPAQHCRLVDAYGQTREKCDQVAAGWQAWQQAKTALEDHQRLISEAAAEQDYLEHAIAELEQLAPQPGEEQTLAETRQKLMLAEQFSEALEEAATALKGAEALDNGLNAVLRKLERRSQPGAETPLPQSLRDVCAALERVVTELNEAHHSVDVALADLTGDPKALEAAEERLFALRAIARKHQLSVDQLPELLERLNEQLGAISDGARRSKELQLALDKAEATYNRLAGELSTARRAAASRLDEAVMAELGPLRLERAVFTTRVISDPAQAGRNGCDTVTFEVATNPGSRPGPLAKVASGGELSRFMLALKVALAACGSAPTLVFDEIDTGIGGSVADAIGQRLARLAKGSQVLAVTHSPQVAARADAHLLISKIAEVGGSQERVLTRVTALDGAQRAEEIARMLSGASVTDEARAQAEKLLQAG